MYCFTLLYRHSIFITSIILYISSVIINLFAIHNIRISIFFFYYNTTISVQMNQITQVATNLSYKCFIFYMTQHFIKKWSYYMWKRDQTALAVTALDSLWMMQIVIFSKRHIRLNHPYTDEYKILWRPLNVSKNYISQSYFSPPGEDWAILKKRIPVALLEYCEWGNCLFFFFLLILICIFLFFDGLDWRWRHMSGHDEFSSVVWSTLKPNGLYNIHLVRYLVELNRKCVNI